VPTALLGSSCAGLGVQRQPCTSISAPRLARPTSASAGAAPCLGFGRSVASEREGTEYVRGSGMK
jgi:hypothetical protein